MLPGSSRFLLACLAGAVLQVTSQPTAASDRAAPLHRIAFSRTGPSLIGLFIATGDGSGEQPLLPASGLDYNASFSSDGRWVVFTSERAGSSDIYRVHPDGSSLERLTDDPAFDDQGVLSPDGKSLAFVSSRSGQADI